MILIGQKRKILILSIFILLILGAFWFWRGGNFFSNFGKNIGGQIKTEIVSNRENYTSLLQFPMTNTYSGLVYPVSYKKVYSLEGLSANNKGETNFQGHVFNCDSDSADSNHIGCSYSKEKLKLFKFFISPASARVGLTIFHSHPRNNDGKNRFVTVSRFGQPPQGDYDINQLAYDDTISFEAANFSQVNGKDFLTRGSGGTTEIFEDDLSRQDNFSGGWLYVRLFEITAELGSVLYFNDVKFDQQKTWYEKVQWQSNGDPADPYIPPSELSGDIEPQSSPDGDVDIFDYNVFIQYWSQSSTNNPADIDQNGKVDIFDYNILVGNFGKTGAQ